jgi:hypothetical protein
MRRYELSERLLSDVEAALTTQPAPPRVVHRRMDCWSPNTVQQALRILVRKGRAVREGERMGLYRVA